MPLTALRRNPEAVLALFDRRPHLLSPLAVLVLPPPARTVPPAERIGLDPAAVRTKEDAARALAATLAAASRGEIAPAEALRIARQLRRRLRAASRLQRLHRLLGRSLVAASPGFSDGLEIADYAPLARF